jgi:hypothetical protein
VLHIKANNYIFKQFNHDLSKVEKNIQFQQNAREGFIKLEEKRGDYYNIRNVGNYYLSHMEYVQDHLRPSMNIAIPANREDCYNL